MSCLDKATLWAMDAGELLGDDLAAARTHARTCLVCETARRELAETRQLLNLAGTAPLPALSWRSVDAAVDDAVTAAASRSFTGFSWRALWVPALATAAAAMFFVTRSPPPVKELAPVAVAAVSVRKQSAQPQQEAVAAVVVSEKKEQTPAKKKASAVAPKTFVTANGSSFDLGQSGLARRQGGDSVQLQKGEAFIRGKRGLVVSLSGAKVKPQSSAVFLASVSPELDVAVAEGAVLVARDDGTEVVVSAGERYTRGKLMRANEAERFSAFGFTVAVKEVPLTRSADLMFIQRAQLSLKSGQCGEFLLGLETLAFDAEAPIIRARARITKARCHDERLEPQKAAADYSRYVRDFPDGEAAAEARAALRAQ